MNRLLALTTILVSCTAKDHSYSWFENDWISDADASIAENPDYAELDANDLQIVRDMYGKVRWIVEGNEFTFSDDRYEKEIVHKVPFEVVSLDAVSFEMVTEAQTYTIWKTDSGFCTVPEPNYTLRFDGSRSELKIECFRPTGT